MGSLKDMLSFLEKTSKCLIEIDTKLDNIQRYFNDNFSNVNEIRRKELEFLQNAFFEDPSSFPSDVRTLYKKKLHDEEEAFERNLKELEDTRAECEKQHIKANNDRLTYFKKVKDQNAELDRREEKLKEQVEKLENEIAEYNRIIDELQSGLGFITNFFKMRKIQEKKDTLLSRRDDIVMRIEDVRAKWEEATKKYKAEENEIMERWNKTQTELSMISEKIEHLRENREELIKRAAFVSALSELKGDEAFITKSVEVEPPSSCPRCKSENKTNRFFCYYCGERFAKDRPDILGSLGEVGELNSVYENLMKGITESVSMLALIRGIARGVQEFVKSVASVKSSEDKYPLPKLNIDVPKYSLSIAKKAEEMNEKIDVKYYNLHPLEFATSFKEYTEKIFTENNIKKFFEDMGDELNRTTKAQWK